MRLRIARLLACKADQAAIDSILGDYSFGADGDVIVVLNARFFSPLTIAKKRGAITQMLETIATIGARSRASGKQCSIVFKKKLNQGMVGKTIFAHHTHSEMFSNAFNANNSVFHFKSGDLPNTMTLDPKGFAGWSSIADDVVDDLVSEEVPFEDADIFYKENRATLRSGNSSKYRQPTIQQDSTSLPDKYVFVALQTVGDIVQQNALINMFDMLDLVVETFKKTDVSVLLKRHPMCRNAKMKEAIGRAVEHNENVHLTEQSIHALLPKAAALFTVNSGVGSEAMIYNIPIYCFGRSDYGAIAHVMDDLKQARATIENLTPKVSYDQLVRFHYFYRKTFQISNAQDLADRVDAILNDRPVT